MPVELVSRKQRPMECLQSRAMHHEQLILVDENDIPCGAARKLDSHQNPGLLHRAFSVLLFDAEGRLLLQQRALHKYTFAGYWSNTCCSHPLYRKEELETTNDLGIKRAVIRRLNEELGISPSDIMPDALKRMTKIHYRADSDASWVEEEIDYLFLVQLDGPATIKPDAEEVCQVKWVTREALMALMAESPEDSRLTPWFRIIIEHFLMGWWSLLSSPAELDAARDDKIHRFIQG